MIDQGLRATDIVNRIIREGKVKVTRTVTRNSIHGLSKKHDILRPNKHSRPVRECDLVAIFPHDKITRIVYLDGSEVKFFDVWRASKNTYKNLGLAPDLWWLSINKSYYVNLKKFLRIEDKDLITGGLTEFIRLPVSRSRMSHLKRRLEHLEIKY